MVNELRGQVVGVRAATATLPVVLRVPRFFEPSSSAARPRRQRLARPKSLMAVVLILASVMVLLLRWPSWVESLDLSPPLRPQAQVPVTGTVSPEGAPAAPGENEAMGPLAAPAPLELQSVPNQTGGRP